jgi:hypothetical protein
MQGFDGAPEHTRDVRRREADALCDLGLVQVLAEAQTQGLSLAVGESAHEAFGGGGVLGEQEVGLVDGEAVGGGARVLLVSG